MGVNLRMKVAITGLVLLVGAASAQVMTVQDRVDSQMAIWGATMAHCRENSAKGDWEVDKKKFKACKKCFSGVGNWFTTDGLQRGMACLEEFEPKTIERCGEIMNHLRLDHHYAEQVILGETPEEQGDPTKPSKLQRVLESLFVEGRCIHANEGNDPRIAECVTCFNKAMPMEQDKGEMMEMKSDKDEEHHLKKVWSQYAACANVFLAPAYSDCMEQMDEILEDSIDGWRSAAGKAKIDQLQACLILKQSNYW